MNSFSLACWLFLIGSAIFTFEAILEMVEAASVLKFTHLLACLFFTVGSLLFLQGDKM